jgi:hypothetical protein
MYCLALVLFSIELYKFYFLRSRHYMKFRAWIAVVNFLSVAVSALFSWRAWSEALVFAALGGDISKTAAYNLQGLAFDRMLVQYRSPLLHPLLHAPSCEPIPPLNHDMQIP